MEGSFEWWLSLSTDTFKSRRAQLSVKPSSFPDAQLRTVEAPE
jgi:hypothetical protein